MKCILANMILGVCVSISVSLSVCACACAFVCVSARDGIQVEVYFDPAYEN